MNWIGLIVSIVYIALVIFSARIFEKKSSEISRKFIHIMLGNWWLIAMIFFNNVWFASILPALFVIINYLSYKNNLIESMEREKQDGFGTVYYALSLLIMVIVSFGIFRIPILGLISTFVMAIGDGFAAIIGSKVKSKKYKLSDTKKSFAGSLTMFCITFFLIVTYMFFMHKDVFFINTHWILVSIMMAFCITSVEAVSGKGTDNITVPITTMALLLLV